jgi:hypothetical protein
VEFIGDPALSPITSIENAAMVRFLYRLSKFYQETVGTETRPNLRPLASYQTHAIVIFVTITSWLLLLLFNTISAS